MKFVKKRVDSVCTYCGVGCDICAEVENEKILNIFAKKEGVVSEGKLCVKGKYGYEYLYHPNRLKLALVRKSFLNENPKLFEIAKNSIKDFNEDFYEISYQKAYEIAAKKIKEILNRYSSNSFAAIGGARTSCESSYLFQKFTREVIGSPHIDNCARVCHSPSLKGLRETIGEGASTNPFSDIYKAQNLVVIGSNTTEAHPIVANKILSAVKNKTILNVIDVREIALSKFATNHLSIPYETNLMILNMLSYEILKNGWENREFIKKRTKGFSEYKDKILNDEFANPDIFTHIRGYEDLPKKIRDLAYLISHKKTLFLWGLGVTEHIDGSSSVMALANLALLTGNIGKSGAGLMPLRGQNNVQGTCDMGCLPYYLPDYKKPKEIGLMTPDIIDAINEGKIKAIFNMGEDIAHIHPNQNKIQQALKKLELLIVNEIFPNEITKYAHIIFGVKSAYEKRGVYINAERRLHLSNPLIESNLPDDWEVIANIAKRLGADFNYKDSKEIWDEVRVVAKDRFNGATYEKLQKDSLRGLQWPVSKKDTPILHEKEFATVDGFGHFKYKKYQLRGMFKELLERRESYFYLTTGRVISQYNNAAQTKVCQKLQKRYQDDILFVSYKDRGFFEGKDRVVLVSKYGKSKPLKIKFSKNLKKGTLFTTFHYAKNHINYLFGDESDEYTKTARFKSIKVKIE